jgi:hypothetical protein
VVAGFVAEFFDSGFENLLLLSSVLNKSAIDRQNTESCCAIKHSEEFAQKRLAFPL